jgi:hypothetical protein
MSEQLRLRGDVAANVTPYVGPSREVVVDTTNNRFVVQDGVTPGGWAAAKLAEVSKVARTPITASYSALASDRLIAAVALTSTITVTLPAAAAFQPGARLLVIDETGVASYTRAIVLAPQGTDVLAGQFSPTIATPYGFLEVESNGLGQWTMSDGLLSQGSGATTTGSSSTSSTTAASLLGVVNGEIARRGVIAEVNITGFEPGEIRLFGVIFTLDGKIAPGSMAHLLLTLNYIGA